MVQPQPGRSLVQGLEPSLELGALALELELEQVVRKRLRLPASVTCRADHQG
jgi:hypothetical protein